MSYSEEYEDDFTGVDVSSQIQNVVKSVQKTATVYTSSSLQQGYGKQAVPASERPALETTWQGTQDDFAFLLEGNPSLMPEDLRDLTSSLQQLSPTKSGRTSNTVNFVSIEAFSPSSSKKKDKQNRTKGTKSNNTIMGGLSRKKDKKGDDTGSHSWANEVEHAKALGNANGPLSSLTSGAAFPSLGKGETKSSLSSLPSAFSRALDSSSLSHHTSTQNAIRGGSKGSSKLPTLSPPPKHASHTRVSARDGSSTTDMNGGFDDDNTANSAGGFEANSRAIAKHAMAKLGLALAPLHSFGSGGRFRSEERGAPSNHEGDDVQSAYRHRYSSRNVSASQCMNFELGTGSHIVIPARDAFCYGPLHTVATPLEVSPNKQLIHRSHNATFYSKGKNPSLKAIEQHYLSPLERKPKAKLDGEATEKGSQSCKGPIKKTKTSVSMPLALTFLEQQNKKVEDEFEQSALDPESTVLSQEAEARALKDKQGVMENVTSTISRLVEHIELEPVLLQLVDLETRHAGVGRGNGENGGVQLEKQGGGVSRNKDIVLANVLSMGRRKWAEEQRLAKIQAAAAKVAAVQARRRALYKAAQLQLHKKDALLVVQKQKKAAPFLRLAAQQLWLLAIAAGSRMEKFSHHLRMNREHTANTYLQHLSASRIQRRWKKYNFTRKNKAAIIITKHMRHLSYKRKKARIPGAIDVITSFLKRCQQKVQDGILVAPTRSEAASNTSNRPPSHEPSRLISPARSISPPGSSPCKNKKTFFNSGRNIVGLIHEFRNNIIRLQRQVRAYKLHKTTVCHTLLTIWLQLKEQQCLKRTPLAKALDVTAEDDEEEAGDKKVVKKVKGKKKGDSAPSQLVSSASIENVMKIHSKEMKVYLKDVEPVLRDDLQALTKIVVPQPFTNPQYMEILWYEHKRRKKAFLDDLKKWHQKRQAYIHDHCFGAAAARKLMSHPNYTQSHINLLTHASMEYSALHPRPQFYLYPSPNNLIKAVNKATLKYHKKKRLLAMGGHLPQHHHHTSNSLSHTAFHAELLADDQSDFFYDQVEKEHEALKIAQFVPKYEFEELEAPALAVASIVPGFNRQALNTKLDRKIAIRRRSIQTHRDLVMEEFTKSHVPPPSFTPAKQRRNSIIKPIHAIGGAKSSSSPPINAAQIATFREKALLGSLDSDPLLRAMIQEDELMMQEGEE